MKQLYPAGSLQAKEIEAAKLFLNEMSDEDVLAFHKWLEENHPFPNEMMIAWYKEGK